MSYNVHQQQDRQTGRPRDRGQCRAQGHGVSSGPDCRRQAPSTTSWRCDLRQALLPQLSCVCFLFIETWGSTGFSISGLKQPQTKTIPEKKFQKVPKLKA